MIIAVKRQWLYELRSNENLTQRDMARIMGISPSHYSNIECGRRGLRGRSLRDHFVTISNHFGVSTDWIHKVENVHLNESSR